MCGLYGSAGFTPERARIDIVAHRGPDGDGWETYASQAGPVALGHRRLSIIDLSAGGAQPMSDPSGELHLVFNGEIYNYIELREELRARGEVFETTSDSEVLLRAYSLYGLDCLGKLRGMFAFLIWDARARRLVAARDRFGIKPLYFAETPAGVAFASEIKQLLDLPGTSRRMNVARAHDFLSSGISDHTAETMFADIRQLRGGECAVVDCSHARPMLGIRRWYAVERTPEKISEKDAAEKFRALLTDAVRLHLRADVPVGSCLSGGLDSSSIVCLMADMLGSRSGGMRVNTVSACYAEKEVDEKPFMDQVAAAAAAQAHFVWPGADDVFAQAEKITWHQDEPFGSTSIFAQYRVFEAARGAGVKVMLDGQGADEQLAGYHFCFPYHLAGLVRSGRPDKALSTMLARRSRHGAGLAGQLSLMAFMLLPGAWREPVRARRRSFGQHDWLGSALIASRGNPIGAQALATRTLGLAEPTDIAGVCMSMTHASNLQMLLHWEDRNAMAHGIEARVPFLDHPLVEFSLALGNAHKMLGAETKRVLREAMRGILPEPVRTRQDKLGFATPEQSWFRGPLKGPLRGAIEATLARYPEIFSAKGVRALADDMLEGRRAVDFTLWRIANFGLWGKVFGAGV